MVTGFLQFWFVTICEKQIDSRNKSVLYCSENCRKEDCGHASSVTSSPRSPIEPPIFKVKEDPPCDIIPQRSPTITTHKPLFSLGGDMPTSETESMDGSEHQKRPSTPRTHSEAASYLGQFHSGVSRPTRFRMSKSTTAINVPSLSTSSNSSTSTSLPFTPASEGYPSLPPRINPHGSIHGFGHKSADLVTPVAFPPTGPASLDTVMTHTPEKVKNVEEPGMEATVEAPSDAKVSYEKRKGIAGNGASPGSLKHLLDEKKAMG
ncbi:MAG: hypothetical protein M1831_001913 [Alyxoria varia]|nr:MAG: hypothetical protein M1831_001913 [Alyxoria varia]